MFLYRKPQFRVVNILMQTIHLFIEYSAQPRSINSYPMLDDLTLGFQDEREQTFNLTALSERHLCRKCCSIQENTLTMKEDF